MRDNPWEEKQFIFIVGLHRSGTSLLHSILRDHPQISGFHDTGVPEDEGQHLQLVLPTGLELGGPGRFVFHQEAYMDENHPLAIPGTAQKLWEAWKPYWEINCPFLIEKSPPNLLRTRFLQKLFPQSWFIAILRHPIAVAYATQKWSKTSIPSLLTHTLQGYKIFWKDKEHLHRVLVLRYETLVSNPIGCVEGILEWLGVSSQKFPFSLHIRPGINEKYFEMWEVDRKRWWKRMFWWLKGGEKQFNAWEAEARLFGYSLLHPDKLLPLPEEMVQNKR